jgi:hypothetical protein
VRWSALLLALLSLGNAAADEPPIRVRVNTKIAQAPATVNGKVIIERHSDNRALVVLLESEGYSLRSVRQIDGEASSRVYDTWWKDLPCGNYNVRAVLVRIENGRPVEKHAIESFRVTGLTCSISDEDDLF